MAKASSSSPKSKALRKKGSLGSATKRAATAGRFKMSTQLISNLPIPTTVSGEHLKGVEVAGQERAGSEAVIHTTVDNDTLGYVLMSAVEAPDEALDEGFSVVWGENFLDPHPTPATEDERQKLLKEAAARAALPEGEVEVSSAALASEVFKTAIDVLGGDQTLGPVTSETELLRALNRGFPITVTDELRKSGVQPETLAGVVAPKRTLARRKAEGQRLSKVESDAAWRLAYLIALAQRVFRDRAAAIEWLSRPKVAIDQMIPFELVQTSFGTMRVEQLLLQLEWGMAA